MNIFQKELLGLQHKQQLLGVLVFSLVTVVVWVSISMITSQTKNTISPVLLKLAKPLTPTLATETIELLEEKRSFTAEELSDFPIYHTVTQLKGRSSRTSSQLENLNNATPVSASDSSPVVITSEVNPETTLELPPEASTDSAVLSQ